MWTSSEQQEAQKATPQNSPVESKIMHSDQSIQQRPSVNLQESRVDNTHSNDERSFSEKISGKQAGNRPYSESYMQNEILRGEDLDAKDSLGYTLLHKAVSGQQLERVKSLVKQGATVDVQDKHGITPLSYAVMFNDQEIVKFLIEEGHANIESGMTYRPLFYAIARGYTELAEYLINRGADVNYQDITGETLIHKAARSGNLNTVKFLVEKAHAEINVLDKYKETPLHAAVNGEVNSGHIEVAKYLIGNGADINLTHNYTPLHLAILRDN